MIPAALVAVVAACLAVGTAIEPARRVDGAAFGWVLRGTAGLVVLYAGLLIFDLAAIGWRRFTLTALVVIAAAGGYLLRRRWQDAGAWPMRSRRDPEPDGAFGWGDAAVITTGALLAVAAAAGWIVFHDFIFHWGIKAHKYALAGGIDYPFLTLPWNATVHPAYPQLAPTLYAATAIVAGRFSAPPMTLWTVVFYAALVIAAREVLRRHRVTRFTLQATLAVLALMLAMFTLGTQLGGSPDWLIALAPLLAWPALATPSGSTPDADRHLAGENHHQVRSAFQVGLVAALAAGSKIEGIPLAAFLLATYLLTHKPAWRNGRALLALLLPPLAIILPWWIQGQRHGLLDALARGSFTLAHADVILAAAGHYLAAREWHGLTALLLALPLLLAARVTRPIALVLGLQLAFYLYAYLSLPFEDPRALRFAVSSLPRLAFHLLPTTLVATALLADRWAAGPPKT